MFFRTVKWFRSFPSNTNTQSNLQTVLFQTIQFNMSPKLNAFKYCDVSLTIQLNITHLFTQLSDQTVLFQTKEYTV